MLKTGIDDYCPYCMSWEEFDINGRCKICGKLIHKTHNQEPTHKDSVVDKLESNPEDIEVEEVSETEAENPGLDI